MPLSRNVKLAGASALAIFAMTLPAFADEASTIIFQQAEPVPVTSTTVEQSTVVEQESATPTLVPGVVAAPVTVAPAPVVVTPTTIVPVPITVAPAGDAVIERSVQIQHTVPAMTTSSTVIIEGPRLPQFRRRISLLQEQINLGLSRGWLSSEQAALFQQRANELMSTAQSLGTLYDQGIADDLEKQINGLNINVSDSMSHGTPIATPPGVIQ